MGGQIITYFVGQCGNQLASAAWELYCLEHCIAPDGMFYDDAIPDNNSFHNFFVETANKQFVPRTLMIDLEPNVLDEVKMGPYRKLFNPDSMINGFDDAANNFARGFYAGGRQIIKDVVRSTRKAVEACDDVEAFIAHHSYGGGTGSGFMSMALEYLSLEYSKKTKIQLGVFPSPILSTSVVEPYNTVLALHCPMENADVAAFFENEALFRLCEHNLMLEHPMFTHLNRMAAQVVSGMTASLRFEGPINSNLIDFQTNLVPYPRIHFPIVSFAPFVSNARTSHQTFSTKEITISAGLKENQMTNIDPTDGACMCCCMLYRGDVNILEVNSVISFMKRRPDMNWVDWCPTGYKVGINYQPMISIPASGIGFSPRALTFLTNSTAIKKIVGSINRKFMYMYDKKSFVHWYISEGMEEEEFKNAFEDVLMLEKDFDVLEETVINKEGGGGGGGEASEKQNLNTQSNATNPKSNANGSPQTLNNATAKSNNYQQSVSSKYSTESKLEGGSPQSLPPKPQILEDRNSTLESLTASLKAAQKSNGGSQVTGQDHLTERSKTRSTEKSSTTETSNTATKSSKDTGNKSGTSGSDSEASNSNIFRREKKSVSPKTQKSNILAKALFQPITIKSLTSPYTKGFKNQAESDGCESSSTTSLVTSNDEDTPIVSRRNSSEGNKNPIDNLLQHTKYLSNFGLQNYADSDLSNSIDEIEDGPNYHMQLVESHQLSDKPAPIEKSRHSVSKLCFEIGENSFVPNDKHESRVINKIPNIFTKSTIKNYENSTASINLSNSSMVTSSVLKIPILNNVRNNLRCTNITSTTNKTSTEGTNNIYSSVALNNIAIKRELALNGITNKSNSSNTSNKIFDKSLHKNDHKSSDSANLNKLVKIVKSLKPSKDNDSTCGDIKTSYNLKNNDDTPSYFSSYIDTKKQNSLWKSTLSLQIKDPSGFKVKPKSIIKAKDSTSESNLKNKFDLCIQNARKNLMIASENEKISKAIKLKHLLNHSSSKYNQHPMRYMSKFDNCLTTDEAILNLYPKNKSKSQNSFQLRSRLSENDLHLYKSSSNKSLNSSGKTSKLSSSTSRSKFKDSDASSYDCILPINKSIYRTKSELKLKFS